VLLSEGTIVAISTPQGRGGIGVVRVSGPSAPAIAAGLLARERPLEPRHATHGHVHEGPADTRAVLDEVVCTWFPGPRSYTGEDVVEISGHGNPLLLSRIVDAAVRHGARLARPGEFTLRAFLNGRMDLVQAEAVVDLIDAVTPVQARLALAQLDGGLSYRITELEQRIFAVVARLEASLDFPEEGYHFVAPGEVAEVLRHVVTDAAALVAGGRRGIVIREGRRVAIVGRPNVGKSSVFNALLGVDRAIVTEIAGTTRDLVAERTDVAGIPVTLVDSAGIREARDPVERVGVDRARSLAVAADALILVLDASAAITDEDRDLLRETGTLNRVVCLNKIDLPRQFGEEDTPIGAVAISARTGVGLDAALQVLADALTNAPESNDLLVTNSRQVALLRHAVQALERACDASQEGASEEFVLADLHEAVAALQEVIGRRAPDAVLQEIFARFCIGK
jgi:tRNA modification GTPase